MGRNRIGNALWKPDATNTSRNPWHLLRCERAWPEFNIWVGTRVSDRSPDPLCAKIPHFWGAFQQPPSSTPRLETATQDKSCSAKWEPSEPKWFDHVFSHRAYRR